MDRTGCWCACVVAITIAATPALGEELTLRWASGGQAISFVGARRCTLIVDTGSNDRLLPPEWRLVWIGEGMSELRVVQEGAGNEGARVASVEQPSPAEQAANQITANFAHAASAGVRSARYLMDLPGGSAGKFRVFAPRQSAGGQTIGVQVSEIATWNGGVSGNFPPVIMAATGDHRTTRFVVSAVGTGLAGVPGARLISADTSWSVPFTVVNSTDSSLTVAADVPVQLPDAILQVEPSDSVGAATTLPTSQVLMPMMESVTPVGNSFLVPPDSAGVSPKDFAFVHNTVPTATPGVWRNLFHLVYIRRLPNGDEFTLGHAWSPDLQNWTSDRYAFRTGPAGTFDARHVWAPTIIQHGNLTYMFYTGVDSARNQRIGRVATALLDTTNTDWTVLGRKLVFAADSTNWVSRHPQLFGFQDQFRDPYVFPHPDSAGRYLMVYTAHDTLWKPQSGLSIGLAINRPGTLDRWIDMGRYGASDWGHNGHISQVEGPIAVPDSGYVPPYSQSGGLPSGWRLMFSWGGPQTDSVSVQFIRDSLAVNVADTTGYPLLPPGTGPVGWGRTQNLYRYLGRDATVLGWQGTEHLKAGNVDYLAAFNAYLFDGIHISRMYWNGSNFTLRVPAVTGIDDVGAATAGLRLRVLDFDPRAAIVKFELESPVAMPVKLEIFDVAGRRLFKLADRNVAAGKTLMKWNRGGGGAGGRTASGIYFARLSYTSGSRVARLPLVR